MYLQILIEPPVLSVLTIRKIHALRSYKLRVLSRTCPSLFPVQPVNNPREDTIQKFLSILNFTVSLGVKRVHKVTQLFI